MVVYRMVIHVKDEETDWLVREFARRRGIGITAAIKVAVEEATNLEKRGVEALTVKIEPIIEQIRARKTSGFNEDKVFMDEMWGEDP
jgi:antitoxin VapB